MAPIDPLQLLKALSPLLSPEGGIRSPDEVSRLSSLMKKFSRKLVSRCIYCNVLRSTSTDILEAFLDLDGWSTIHMWLQEAKTSGNMTFLCELLNLCDALPMSLERLKENTAPKLIKSLMKSGDDNVRAAAEKVVSGWMKLIKGHSKDASEHSRKADTTVKKKSKKSLSLSSVNPLKAVSVKKNRSNDSVDETAAAGNTSVLDDTAATADNINELEDTHNPSVNSSSSTASSDKESPSDPAESPPKKAKRADRPKTVKTFRARFRSTGLEEASPPPPAKAGTKKVSRPAVDKHAIQKARERFVPTVHADPWVKPSSLLDTEGDGRCSEGPGIRLIGVKQMHVLREDAGFMDALTAAPTTPNAGTPRRKRKPLGAAAAAKRANSPDGPSQPAPKLHFYKDTLEGAETATPEEEGDDAKARDVTEDDEDDDIAKRVKRRKRGRAKASDSEDVASPEEGGDSPPTPTQDEDATATERRGARKTREVEATDGAAEMTDEAREEDSTELPDPASDKPASILSMTRKKTKKSVTWVEESKLRQFHYFELDETERVNVSKQHNFGDMKTLEIKRERQAVETARRLMDDRMEEAIPFRAPRRLTLPEALVKRGANSQEKETQKLRQQHTLQEIYFSKEMIPDSPHEADPEQLSSEQPTLIPLEDENPPSGTLDYSRTEPSEASRLPPILSNLVRSIAPKGQKLQSDSSPHRVTQQEAQGQFPGPMPQQAGLLQNLTGVQCSGAGQIPPGMQLMGMYPNSMQNQGMHMMGSPMHAINGTGGFPMAVSGPMHPHGGGVETGDWGMMRPGMPEDGAGFYAPRGPPPMSMTPMSGGQQGMDVQRNGSPHGRNAPMRNHRPRVPCKFFMNSHCRFGAGCSFLHPGVNGPPLQ